MRRLLIASLTAASLAIGIAAPASAAPAMSPAYYNWSGFYIGGNLGGAWGSFDPMTSTQSIPGAEFAPSSLAAFNAAGMQSIKASGFTGGFEAGYNWQFGNYLFGVEGDIESFRLRGSANSGAVVYPCCAPSTFTVNADASTTWLATLRGRIGYAAGNWLFYATGGAAFTTLHADFAFSETFNPSSEAASISATKIGYTAGGGVEVGLWQRWSVKAEYLYVDFGTVSTSGIDGVGILPITQPFSHSIDLKANIARLGLNYHF